MFLRSIKSNYDSDGACIKCPNCKSTEINQHVVDSINGYASEIEEYCNNCKKRVGYWAYGSYDPCFKLGDPSLQMLWVRVRMRLREMFKRNKDYGTF